MKHWKVFPILLISFTLALLLMNVSNTSGRDFRLDKLPDKGRNWRCATCHNNPGGGGPRNAFGQDYERIALPAGDQYTEALGKIDSDGDGFTNDQEFNANPPTEPWNRASKPPDEPQAVTSKGKKFVIWAKLKAR